MPNFCPHCGSAVSENNTVNCLSCEKPLSSGSEATKNDTSSEPTRKILNFAKNLNDFSTKAIRDLSSEETNAKIKNFTSQAKSFASEKTKDLKEELDKINDARKETANEAKNIISTSKIETSKVIALSFWSKLTSKQKTLLLLIAAGFVALVSNVFSDSVLDDVKRYNELFCEGTDLEIKHENPRKARELMDKANALLLQIYKTRTSEIEVAQRKFEMTVQKRNYYCYSHGFWKNCPDCNPVDR